MASEYDWSLPSFGSGGSSSYNVNNYDLGSSGGGGNLNGTYNLGSPLPDTFNFEDDDWFVDSSSGSGSGGGSIDTSMFDDLWGWVRSDQGTSVLGGALGGLMNVWKADLMGRTKDKTDGPSSAELYDARVKKHNASINTPMDMGLIKLQRPK